MATSLTLTHFSGRDTTGVQEYRSTDTCMHACMHAGRPHGPHGPTHLRRHHVGQDLAVRPHHRRSSVVCSNHKTVSTPHHYSTTPPLHHYSTTPLQHYTKASHHHYSTTALHHYTKASHHCTTALHQSHTAQHILQHTTHFTLHTTQPHIALHCTTRHPLTD